MYFGAMRGAVSWHQKTNGTWNFRLKNEQSCGMGTKSPGLNTTTAVYVLGMLKTDNLLSGYPFIG